MWSNRANRSRRWFLRMLLLAVLAVGIGSALMYAVSLSSISQVRAAVNEAHSWSSLIRLAIIGGVAALWGPIVRQPAP